MKFIFVLAVFVFRSFICYAAEAPLQCASAPSSQSNDEVIFFRVSGSTNTPPVCYTVSRSGTVIKETGASRFQRRPEQPVASERRGSIPASQAEQIFSDVEAAMPLSALPRTHCAKSVSFGTFQHVFFKGEKSPDLCGRDNEKITTLKGDLAKIMSTAYFEQAKP
ncbi:MAG: hypothetical protein WCC04_19015 [Terriglobales bacterium]